ncbi:C2H2-like zinc finger protein [Gossypium australe]|uniref:C2H2-like zinc finger protein n=1 Tax=Gossypium australe TaxID=47621 RepID=A0A5B6VD73_9ROSI|nr:C2H2-like zinc finger protein [Gossypium australe]
MALLTFLPEAAAEPMKQPPKRRRKQLKKQKQPTTSSWDQIKNLLTCKQMEGSKVHDPSKNNNPAPLRHHQHGYSKLGSSCSSICSFRDVVHGNTRVVHRADNSPESSTVGQETALLRRKAVNGSSSRSLSGSTRSNNSTTTSSSSRAIQFTKLSGCYECHTIVDPSRYPSSRTSICACSQCGEVFPKIESLELHQAVRHAEIKMKTLQLRQIRGLNCPPPISEKTEAYDVASSVYGNAKFAGFCEDRAPPTSEINSFVGLVSELGPEDSGRNIVEIIFKSSWLKKDNPICKIERILKVHNNQRTIQRFEDCRDAVKTRALNSTRKNPRCAADGNELLRFHCTTLSCSLGARGSSSLCGSIPGCGVCTIIRQGFQNKGGGSAPAAELKGVVTTACSGRAHDSIKRTDGRRAMLVCRVIAGRVKRVAEEAPPLEDENSSGVSSSAGSYDSVAAYAGVYSNLEELVVFNPRAILPCFVVIYKALESGLI